MVDLSIIIPMYKGKLYIQNTLSEIVKIECRKEIIVIDDGSPDDSFDYVKECFSKTGIIKVYKKLHGGIADTRNYGLLKASGMFVLFVDQDDRINPVTVSAAVKIMKEDNYSAVMWTTMFEYEDGTSKVCDDVSSDRVANKTDIHETIIPALLSREKCEYTTYPGHIWGGVFRRDIIESNNIRLKRFVDYEDDFLFVFDYLLNSDAILFFHEIGYYWFTNQRSYSHSFKYVDDYIEKSERFGKYLEEEYESSVGHPLDAAVLTYLKQYTIIGAIKNACGVGNHGLMDNQEITRAVKRCEYIKAFRKSVHFNDRRELLIAYLVKIGMTSSAIFLTRAYYRFGVGRFLS